VTNNLVIIGNDDADRHVWMITEKGLIG
jgi:hypothetical protein